MTDSATNYTAAWTAEPDGRTSDEIYQSIVEKMKKKHGLCDAEAHKAARNMIGFCREMMNICSISFDE